VMAVIGVEIRAELREKVREAYRVTLPSLFTSQIFGLFGGTFLGKYFEVIRTQFPGLLVVLPGIPYAVDSRRMRIQNHLLHLV